MNQRENFQGCLKGFQSSFSHIYIERDAKENDITKELICKFPNSRIIEIENYREVFNRPKQNFEIQKKSPKLIIANKRYDFIYKGSELCENFGQPNFYYSSNILNCIYNCEYCYLQGMYTSANIVVFVNIEDYFKEIKRVSMNKKIYICISYDSDILALEGITGITGRWIEFAGDNPNVLIEIRTKSANFRSVEALEVPVNVIFAWTLSPDEVIDEYEFRTPKLKDRIDDINRASSKGMKIRISVEPVMKIKDFERVYSDFADKVFNSIDIDAVRDVNIDVFRMRQEHIKRIRKLKEGAKIFGYPMKNLEDNAVYADSEYMKEYVRGCIAKYVEADKIY